MHRIMLPVLVFVLASACLAADPVVYFDHAKVDAGFAKGGTMFSGEKYKVITGRRDAPGEVEIHTKDTDVMYVVEGTATLITGGTVTNSRQTGAEELRGTAITGGQTLHLSKGDVVVIPAGTPHWMPETSKPFLYFVVKAR